MSKPDYHKPIEKLSKAEKHERFKAWFKLSFEAFLEQRKRERQHLLFQTPENQWPEGTNRQGRPTIEVDILRHPMQLVQNQASQSHVGVELHPIDEKASKELAEAKQGLYSRIQRDGMASQARLWAVKRAIRCGMGWYRILTQYDEDSDDPTDMEIVYGLLPFQEMVFPDPAAQRPDFQDGRFLAVAAYVPAESFPYDYDSATISDFKSFIETDPDWVRTNGESCDPLVVEMFYKMHYQPAGERRKRDVVWRALLTAGEPLSDEPWLAPAGSDAGRRYIPFVPAIGDEQIPVDGKRVWVGMIGPAMGAQIAHNFFASTLVETVASEPKNPIMAPDESIGPYQKLWDALAISNPAYLPFKAMSDGEGRPLQPPFRMPSDQGRMSTALLALGQSKNWVESTTAFNPSSLGEVEPNQNARSGRAIKALQGATEAGSSQYMHNLESISLPLDARIVLDMMPVVYDRPGRVTQVLGGENKARVVMLNAPFVMQDGRPVAAKPGTQGAQSLNLADGRYSIVPKIGTPPQTRLERGQEFMTAVIQAAPELLPVMGDKVFEFRDEPGSAEVAKRIKRWIQRTNPGLIEEEGEAEDAQAKLAAATGQLQQLQGELQQAADYIKTEQAKHESAERMKQAELAAKVHIQQMQDATTIAVAQINAEVKGLQIQTEAQNEQLATGLKAAHEIREAEKDRFHEVQARHEDMAHEKAMATAGANTMTRTVEGGQDTAQEHTQEQGHETLPPEPQADGAGE